MIRAGIIGLGGIARSHAAAIAELDNVEIAAVADLFADKRAQFMEQWGVAKGYATHTELLQTPPSTRWPSLWGINSITA